MGCSPNILQDYTSKSVEAIRGHSIQDAIDAALTALDTFAGRLGKAKLVSDGVQGLKQKDIEAILADLTEKLPALVPGLP